MTAVFHVSATPGYLSNDCLWSCMPSWTPRSSSDPLTWILPLTPRTKLSPAGQGILSRAGPFSWNRLSLAWKSDCSCYSGCFCFRGTISNTWLIQTGIKIQQICSKNRLAFQWHHVAYELCVAVAFFFFNVSYHALSCVKYLSLFFYISFLLFFYPALCCT